MKNNILRSFLIIAVLSLFLLTGCTKDGPTLESVVLKDDNPTEILTGKFDDYKFYLKETYSDDSVKDIEITRDMISNVDYFKTFKEGIQTIAVNYSNKTFTLTLTVKSLEYNDNVIIVNQTITYDGKYHSLEVEGEIPEGTKIVFPNGNSFKNAGTYPIKAVLASDKYITKEITGTLIIEKADFDESLISFTNKVCTYNGNKQNIIVQGNLPSDAVVKYYIDGEEINEKTDAGNYEVVARINLGQNYNTISDKRAHLIIEKASYDLSDFRMLNKSYNYTGDAFRLSLSNEALLPNGVTVSYYYALIGSNDFTLEEPINAGIYTCKAEFKGDPNNFNDITPIYATLTINKARIKLTDVHFDGQKFTYDKTAHSIYYTGKLPTGVLFNRYEGNTKIDVGKYTVKAYFTYKDTINYEAIEPLIATLEIEKADITGIEFNNQEIEYNGFGNQIRISYTEWPDGLIVSYDKKADDLVEPGDYTITASFSATPNSEAALNYKIPSNMTATLTISKKDISSSFVSKQVTYDGLKHTLTADTTDLEEWITPNYYIYNKDSINSDKLDLITDSNAPVEPGTYVIFVIYSIKDDENYEEHKADFDAHYNDIVKDSAVLTITKINFDIIGSIKNRQFLYVPGTYQVPTWKDDYDVQNFINTYCTVRFKYFTLEGTEEINKTDCVNSGIYRCKVSIELNEEARKHYYAISDTEFVFAIKDTSNPYVYTPIYTQNEFTYDKESHSVYVNNSKKGISIGYSGNGKINADTYSVYITFSFADPVYKFYYDFPSGYSDDTNGNKYYVKSLIINKKEAEIVYDLDSYEYDGTNKNIKVLSMPDYASLSRTNIVYEDDERIVPGTYKVTVTPTIIDPDAQINYKATKTELYFTIKKAVPSYTVGDLDIVYDGQKHKVKVYNLPDGFDYTSVGDNQIDIGDYPVTVKFTNGNQNLYENLKDIRVTLSIKNNKTNSSKLSAVLETSGKKSINQFTSIRDIFSQYIDVKAFDIAWSIDYYEYYEGEGVILSKNNEHKGISSTNHSLDYQISYPNNTNNGEYLLLNFTLNLKTGYVNTDSNIGSSYSNHIEYQVIKALEYDISELDNKFSTTYQVNEGTGIRDILRQYLDFSKVKISFTVDYYNGNEKYLNTNNLYHGIGDASNEFFLNINTWGNKYALVTYTVVANDGYSLAYNGSYSLTYTKGVKVAVKPVTIVDNSFVNYAFGNNSITFDQYTNITEYMNNIIDKNNTNYSWILKQGETVIGNQDSEKIVLTNSDSYTLTISVTPNENLVFSDLSDNIDKTITVNINAKTKVQVSTILNYFNNKNNTLYQYQDLFIDLYGDFVVDNKINYNYTIYDGENEIKDMFDGTNSYIFNYPTSFDRIIKMHLTLSPKNGYVLVDDDNANIGTTEIEIIYTIKPVTIIDTSELKATINILRTTTEKVNQYDTLDKYIKTELDNLLNKYTGLTITITYNNNNSGNVDFIWDKTKSNNLTLSGKNQYSIKVSIANTNNDIMFDNRINSTDTYAKTRNSYVGEFDILIKNYFIVGNMDSTKPNSEYNVNIDSTLKNLLQTSTFDIHNNLPKTSFELILKEADGTVVGTQTGLINDQMSYVFDTNIAAKNRYYELKINYTFEDGYAFLVEGELVKTTSRTTKVNVIPKTFNIASELPITNSSISYSIFEGTDSLISKLNLSSNSKLTSDISYVIYESIDGTLKPISENYFDSNPYGTTYKIIIQLKDTNNKYVFIDSGHKYYGTYNASVSVTYNATMIDLGEGTKWDKLWNLDESKRSYELIGYSIHSRKITCPTFYEYVTFGLDTSLVQVDSGVQIAQTSSTSLRLPGNEQYEDSTLFGWTDSNIKFTLSLVNSTGYYFNRSNQSSYVKTASKTFTYDNITSLRDVIKNTETTSNITNGLTTLPTQTELQAPFLSGVNSNKWTYSSTKNAPAESTVVKNKLKALLDYETYAESLGINFRFRFVIEKITTSGGSIAPDIEVLYDSGEFSKKDMSSILYSNKVNGCLDAICLNNPKTCEAITYHCSLSIVAEVNPTYCGGFIDETMSGLTVAITSKKYDVIIMIDRNFDKVY